MNSVKKERGFSLVEILVAVAVFSVVMVAGTAAVLVIVDANQKSQSLNSLMTNLTIAFESMSKSIRTGSQYDVTSVPGGFQFQPSDAAGANDKIAYKRVVSGSTGKIVRTTTICTPGCVSTDVDMTAPDIDVQTLSFTLVPAVPSPTKQPRVIIVLRGFAGVKAKTGSNFNLQTTVSQRTLNGV